MMALSSPVLSLLLLLAPAEAFSMSASRPLLPRGIPLRSVQCVYGVPRRDFARSLCVNVGCLVITRPAAAKYGESAKIAGGIQELSDAIKGKGEPPQGPSVYDAESLKLQEERIAKVDKEWARLVRDVDLALQSSNPKAAASAVNLRMGTIKPKMREISRIAVDGDVIVRAEGKQSPKFDYNSGKFEFKEIVQIPEDMFLLIGKVAAACNKNDVEMARHVWTSAKAVFEQWCVALKAQDRLQDEILRGA